MAYTMEIKGDKLIITVDVDAKTIKAAPLSSKGKNKLVASTGPFEKVGHVKVGMNVIADK